MTIHHLHLPDDVLAAFCARWKVTELALFGSALRDDFGPESDIDLLVTFAPDARWSLFDLSRMERELEAMTGRPVDLMTKRSMAKGATTVSDARPSPSSRAPRRRRRCLLTLPVDSLAH